MKKRGNKHNNDHTTTLTPNAITHQYYIQCYNTILHTHTPLTD